jgi:pimeloyl-ACP methyl ester carboxylesterase
MLHFLDLGNKKSDVIVFVHGLGGSKENWEPQHRFAQNYRLIIPDMQGHGESIVENSSTISNNARKIIELLEHLGIENAHFVGLSMGGAITQEVYRQNKKVVKSMTLANTFSSFAPFTWNPFYMRLIEKGFIKKVSQENYVDLMAQRCFYSVNDQVKETLIKGNRPDKKAYIDAAKSCLNASFLSMLPTIKVPVQVIGSMYDAVTTPYLSIQQYKLIPNAKISIFKNCGHVSNIEKPDEFNEVLDQFLSQNT